MKCAPRQPPTGLSRSFPPGKCLDGAALRPISFPSRGEPVPGTAFGCDPRALATSRNHRPNPSSMMNPIPQSPRRTSPALGFPATLLFAGLAWCVLTTAATAAVPSPKPLTPAFLTHLIDEATTNHPGLRAAHLRQTAAERAVDGVRTWEDPMVRFGGSVAGDPGPDLEMEGDLIYELDQNLPLFGKASAMRREAEAGAAVATAERTYRFQLLRLAVVQAAGQLALADETLTIGADDLALVERMTAFARERQRSGLDATLDLLRLENERDKRNQQQITDRLQRDVARSALNRLLARPLDAPWVALALPELSPEIPMSERLFALGTQYEPRLQVMRRDITMAEAGTEVVRRSRFPDVSVGIEGRQWSGSGGFREGMFTLGLSLPWLNRGKYRADLDRQRARAEATRAELQDYELDVRQELLRIWTRIDAARREAILYQETIIPRANLVVSTSLSAWTAGRGMFLDVIESRRMLTEARLMRARAGYEQHQMITELITCCGLGELDSLLMLTEDTDPAPLPIP